MRLSGCSLALCLAFLIALPVGAEDATPGATPAVAPASVEIAAQETLGPDVGTVLSLSPDGTYLALVRPAADGDGAEICAAPTVSREVPTCAPLADPEIAADSVAWSPDGTRFAFTENATVALIDADIHVFDRTDGSLTDLTDDGVAGSLFDLGAEPVAIDLAPAWSPDGEEIAFARGAGSANDESVPRATAIYRIPATGGDPTAVTAVADDWFAVYAGIRWREDGTFLYSVGLRDDPASNGLWAIPAEGGDPEQLVAAADLGTLDAILVDVSIGGQGLLRSTVDEPTGYGSPVRFATVDLASGQTEPVTLADDGPLGPTALAAGFAPDGGSLLLAVSPPGDAVRLVLRDLETGEDADLGPLDATVGATDARAGLTWGANGLVLAPAAQNTSLLITLRDTGTDD